MRSGSWRAGSVSMAREVQAREARLREEVRELRIEIDHVREAHQVAEITEVGVLPRPARSGGRTCAGS